MTAILDEADEFGRALAGTPYTVEYGSAIALRSIVGGRLHTFAERARRLAVTYPSKNLHPLTVPLRVREVYESNALEGLGLGLIATERTMRQMVGLPSLDVARFTVARALASDRHAYEVIGLQSARELADLIADSTLRPVTESDLRSMHRLIMGDTVGSGQYKRYVNRISGSEHLPPAPSDVPAHMRGLTSWLSTSDAHPLVQATVAHAWMTHVHPFDDGNGRMARLLTNLILARASYPPVIVKASAHRQPYLDALADSDRGGDILPLVGVFSRLMKATFRQVEKPEVPLRIWKKLMENREPSAFKRWQEESEALISAVRGQLPSPFALVRIGSLDSEDYELLASSPNHISPRLASITIATDTGFGLQLVASRPSPAAREISNTRHPSLRFLYKTHDPHHPKFSRWLAVNREFKYDEIILRPEALPTVVLRSGSKHFGLGTRSGAAELVDQIVNFATRYKSASTRELLLAKDFLEPGALSKNPKPRRTKTRFELASTWWHG